MQRPAPSICSLSSLIASRCSCASRALDTIWSMRCSRFKARTISFARSSAASRRWENSSTPRTARICSPATSARPTSSASRRRRTHANTSARPNPSLYRQDEERALASAIDAAKAEASAAVAREDFEAAMARHGEASPPRRCVLRQGDGQRRRTSNCARTGSSCSTKSARRPARSPISPASKGEHTRRHARESGHPVIANRRDNARSCEQSCR